MDWTKSRPLDARRPYYKWYDYNGHLGIESECCADAFGEEEERVLLAYLTEKYREDNHE